MLVQSQQQPVRIIGFTSASNTFLVNQVAQASCDGMARCTGAVAYTAAPGGPPTIEVSVDGSTWEATTALVADAAILPAGSGFTWNFLIGAWRFIQITLPQGGVGVTAQACVELWPRAQ